MEESRLMVRDTDGRKFALSWQDIDDMLEQELPEDDSPPEEQD